MILGYLMYSLNGMVPPPPPLPTPISFCLLTTQEQQKPAKRKYTKKQRPPAPVAPVQAEAAPPSPPPAPEPAADFSPDRRMEYYSASLLDHEYTAGPGPFGPGGPRGSGAMAPGVFLTSRRPSLSPQNSSTYSPSGVSPAGQANQGATGAGQGKHRIKQHIAHGHTLLSVNIVLLNLPFHLYPSGKRPKKGLATAKQRLGKILKIHRNGKLLL